MACTARASSCELGKVATRLLIYSTRIADSRAFVITSFNNMISTLMVNRTTTPFVLPMIGMYEVSIDGESLIVMPVTSKHAILLFSKELSDKVITSNGKILFHLVDEERAKEFNFHAMETEIATNKVAVASGEKKALEEISAEACTFNLESKINDTNK